MCSRLSLASVRILTYTPAVSDNTQIPPEPRKYIVGKPKDESDPCRPLSGRFRVRDRHRPLLTAPEWSASYVHHMEPLSEGLPITLL